VEDLVGLQSTEEKHKHLISKNLKA